jgi:hypothetical protein
LLLHVIELLVGSALLLLLLKLLLLLLILHLINLLLSIYIAPGLASLLL